MTAPVAKVALLDFEPGKHVVSPDIERSILGAAATIVLVRAPAAEAVFSQIIDADVIIVWSRFELNAGALAQLKNCRGIVCASVGYDHIDLAAATSLDIPVCNVPDYGTEEVADHTMALLLALVRKIVVLNDAVRSGVWDWQRAGAVRRLRGQSLGIVGFGRIGSAVARRAQSFGLDVSFYDPFIPSGIEKAHAVRRHETLHALLQDADIVSLHAPHNEHTSKMIDRAALSTLRPGALLLNTARGQLVDTSALVEALTSGRLDGAGLDVLSDEPQVPEELLRSERVVLTPHSAWSSVEGFADNRRKSALAALRFLKRQPVRDVVNGLRTGHQSS